MKRVEFCTLGCKVNQYETQAIREQLLEAGFQENNSPKADIYLINTCTVTHQADRQSRQIIRRCLKANPNSKVIVTGCYVEKDAPEILQISPRIQIVPNQLKHRILDFLESTIHDSQFTNNKSFIPLKISNFQGHERAFVKIQDGCDNFCAFCKVPLVRGCSRSRDLKEIIAEAERLVHRGFKEIVLTGICLGDYHYENYDLSDVISSLEKIKGEFRIRLSSIEPQLVGEKLIAKMADSQKICPHLHIPLQSGDNGILKKMNRRYTVEDYLSLITKIKKKIKDVAITTDVLAGFPGEGDKNFRHTIRCLKRVLPLRTHIFSFSSRPQTKAFNFKGCVEPKAIKERVNLLKETAQECSFKFRKGFLGRTLTVLVESQSNQQSGLFCGYAENYIRLTVENVNKEDINSLIKVKVKAVDLYSTKAQRVHFSE